MIEIEAEDPGSTRVFAWDCLPLSVGRRGASYVVDRPGVWDRHVVLSRDPEGWIVATSQGDAAVFCGGEQLGPMTRLRNGDILELGSARLRFRISNCRQYTLRGLETLTWYGLLALVVAQVLLLVRF